MQEKIKTKKMKDNRVKKVLFVASVNSHILYFHIPYLKMFKDMGYEVSVATNGSEKIPYSDKKYIVSFERNPFKFKNIKALRKLKKIINEENFDIIHTHTPVASAITRIAAKRARKRGTKVIYTAHGFHFYKGSKLINWMLFYPIEKHLSKYTDVLITINEEDYNIASKKFYSKNIEYINGIGVDIEKFKLSMSEKEKETLRKKIGVSKDDFVIVCVGELNNNKNQIMQIKAIKRLITKNKNIKLVLIGEGINRKKLEKKIKNESLQNNVILLGYRKDVPRLLKICDLVLSTSKREGLPVSIIEAEIENIPVIVTNCRGNKDLVEDEINGYIVDINDYDKLADKIEYIQENNLIVNNEERVKQYSLSLIQEKMKRIYKIATKK